MGGEIQQLKTGGLSAQLEVLPVWMHRRLLYSSLPVPKTDDVHVGQVAKADKASVLQHEIVFVIFGVPLASLGCRQILQS